MDPKTGKLYATDNSEYAKNRGLIELDEKEYETLRRMNRHERRAWAAKNRRAKKG